MIRVIVRKDHFFNVGQVYLQVACILQHVIGMGSRIQQNAMTICFDQRGETPLTHPGYAAHQHS